MKITGAEGPLSGFVMVFLDGERILWCREADEEEGYVIFSEDRAGMPTYVWRTKRGKIELRLREDAPDDMKRLWEEKRRRFENEKTERESARIALEDKKKLAAWIVEYVPSALYVAGENPIDVAMCLAGRFLVEYKHLINKEPHTARIAGDLRRLSADERLELFADYCPRCGRYHVDELEYGCGDELPE